MGLPQIDTVHIRGIPFSCARLERVLEAIEAVVHAGGREYISITNTESLYYATRMESHGDYVRDAALSCCDGVGAVLAGRALGHRIPRIHGPDLMAAVCAYGVERGWRHFFYGGKDGVPEQLSKNLTERSPGLITAGTFSPPFRPLSDDEDARIVAMINEAKADFVWVGLGLLKQEQWVSDHRDRIDAAWMSGVGAAFDFYAGTVRRAPAFFQKIGLEWAYRLAFEPRMFVRNWRSFVMLLCAIGDALRQRLRGAK